jgi:geranylgeranylglycerol-phosphate geranylgeranyltransferase
VIAISILPFLFGWIGWRYGVPIFIMDDVILYEPNKLLNAQSSNRRSYIRWIYLSALAAILVFIILKVVI